MASSDDTRGECFFCGATDRKLTKEHAWSAWLANVMPDRGRIKYFRSSHVIDSPEPPKPASWWGKDFELTVKAVCEPCNGGWMNDVENAARPFLESMILGRGRDLYRGGQEKVATWGAMKAMVFQAKDRDVPIPVAHRRELYERRLPPTRCQVWLGGFSGKVWMQRHYGLGIDRTEQASIPAYGSTFAVGHLIFQVFGHEVGEGFRRDIRGSLDASLVEVWPYSREPLRWPPPLVVDDGGLVQLSDTFARTADAA